MKNAIQNRLIRKSSDEMINQSSRGTTSLEKFTTGSPQIQKTNEYGLGLQIFKLQSSVKENTNVRNRRSTKQVYNKSNLKNNMIINTENPIKLPKIIDRTPINRGDNNSSAGIEGIKIRSTSQHKMQKEKMISIQSNTKKSKALSPVIEKITGEFRIDIEPIHTIHIIQPNSAKTSMTIVQARIGENPNDMLIGQKIVFSNDKKSLSNGNTFEREKDLDKEQIRLKELTDGKEKHYENFREKFKSQMKNKLNENNGEKHSSTKAKRFNSFESDIELNNSQKPDKAKNLINSSSEKPHLKSSELGSTNDKSYSTIQNTRNIIDSKDKLPIKYNNEKKSSLMLVSQQEKPPKNAVGGGGQGIHTKEANKKKSIGGIDKLDKVGNATGKNHDLNDANKNENENDVSTIEEYRFQVDDGDDNNNEDEFSLSAYMKYQNRKDTQEENEDSPILEEPDINL